MDIERQLPPEEIKWFASFRAMIREKGYNTPLAMALICVRNEPSDKNLLNTIQYSYEDANRIFDEAEAIAQPAFIPVDENGKPLNPLVETGKSAESSGKARNTYEWLYKNTIQDLDHISNEQIRFLYKMAAANRLFVKADDLSADTYSKNRYFTINEDGSCGLSPDLASLYQERKKNPDAAFVGPYSVKVYDALNQEDEAVALMESYVPTYIGGMDMHLRQQGSMDEPLSENTKNYLKRRDELNSQRDLMVHAHMHPAWYRTQEDAELMAKLYASAKKGEERTTEDDLELLREYPVIALGFDDLEKSILKLTGKRDLDELQESGMVLDKAQQPISGETSLQFAAALGRNLMASSDSQVYIQGKPYKFMSGYGLQEVAKVEPYRDEIAFLVGRLKKTEGNLTSNSPQYDRFSKALKELPGMLSNAGEAYSYEQIRGLLSGVDKLGQEYIEAHKKKPLDARQIERVKVINRLSDIMKEARKKNPEPGKNLDYRLAEKLFTASAVQSKNQNLLLYADVRERTISSIMESKAFKNEMASLNEQEKMTQLKTPGAKYLKRSEPNLFLFDGFVKYCAAQKDDIDHFASAAVRKQFERKQLPNPIGIRAGRISIQTLAICKMLRSGENYTLNEILDPTGLIHEKGRFGQLAVQDITQGNGESIRADLMEGGRIILEHTKKLLTEMPDLSMKSAMDPRFRNMGALGVLLGDLLQELQHDGLYRNASPKERQESSDLQSMALAATFAGNSIQKSCDFIQAARTGEIPASAFAMNYTMNFLQQNIVSEGFKAARKQAGKGDILDVLLKRENGELVNSDLGNLFLGAMTYAMQAFEKQQPALEKLANQKNPKAIETLLRDSVEDKFQMKYNMKLMKTNSGNNQISVECKNPEILTKALAQVKGLERQ